MELPIFGDQYDEDDFQESQQTTPIETIPKGQKRSFKSELGEDIEKIILKFRACTQCRIILSEQQFCDYGCPNCPELGLDGNRLSVLSRTSSNFSGMIGLMKPADSWVAKFNKLVNRYPGFYAVSVSGENLY